MLVLICTETRPWVSFGCKTTASGHRGRRCRFFMGIRQKPMQEAGANGSIEQDSYSTMDESELSL